MNGVLIFLKLILKLFHKYFSTIGQSFVSLFVLLTTAK